MSNRKLASGAGVKKKDRNFGNHHHDDDSNSKSRDERHEQVNVSLNSIFNGSHCQNNSVKIEFKFDPFLCVLSYSNLSN